MENTHKLFAHNQRVINSNQHFNDMNILGIQNLFAYAKIQLHPFTYFALHISLTQFHHYKSDPNHAFHKHKHSMYNYNLKKIENSLFVLLIVFN